MAADAALLRCECRVPPYPTEVAKEIIAAELTGGDVNRLSELFSDLPSEPVASASLGQVRTERQASLLCFPARLQTSGL